MGTFRDYFTWTLNVNVTNVADIFNTTNRTYWIQTDGKVIDNDPPTTHAITFSDRDRSIFINMENQLISYGTRIDTPQVGKWLSTLATPHIMCPDGGDVLYIYFTRMFPV
jgi:hypothetical protein